MNFLSKLKQFNQTRFSFGATSAIITNLGLITGLDSLAHPKISMISTIVIVAVVDNIADSVGIHVFQESECVKTREVWNSTITNFFTRVLVSSTFVALIALLPLNLAVTFSVAWGLVLLAALSYIVAKRRGVNPFFAIFEHLVIAAAVITVGHYVGGLFAKKFQGL